MTDATRRPAAVRDVPAPMAPVVALPSLPPVASSEPAPTDTRPAAPALGWISAPALALLAAVAIFEGYRWLHLVPGRLSVSDTLLLAAVDVAIAFGLTSAAVWTHEGAVRRAARLGSCAFVGAALVVRVLEGPPTDRLLGTTSLVLAVAALCVAVPAGKRRRPHDPASSSTR